MVRHMQVYRSVITYSKEYYWLAILDRRQLQVVQLYPEGRDRLLALAVSSKSSTKPLSLSSTPCTSNNNDCSAVVDNTISPAPSPAKPKMGLKDVRRTGNLHITTTSTPLAEQQQKIRPLPVYSSEQSLPEKFSQAFKGLAIRPASSRQHGGSAAVTADDVVYYSSGNNNNAASNDLSVARNLNNESHHGNSNLHNNNHKRSLSKSSEKLNNAVVIAAAESPAAVTCNNNNNNNLHFNNKCNVQQQSQTPQQQEMPNNARYSKVKQYSYGVNLEDLRKMYKSMPNCSADDEYDGIDATAANANRAHGQATNNGNNAVRNSFSDDNTYANIDELRRLAASSSVTMHHQSSDESVVALMQNSSSSSNKKNCSNNSSDLPIVSRNNNNGGDVIGVLRNSCGSPTDSGYRSVPRELDYDSQVTSTTTRVADDPLYVNAEQLMLQQKISVASTASKNNNQNKCSVLIDSAPDDSTASNLAPKNRSRKATHGDESSITCHSPDYSDLSSPGYNSSTQSSGRIVAPPVNGRQPTNQIKAPAAVVGSFDTINTNVSLPEEFSLDRCPKLVELDRVPWNEKDVVTVLQKGRTKHLVNQIAIDVVPRLTYILQRPLVRLAKETQRLCTRFNKCTKHEIQCATKIILPCLVGESCTKAALQASAMYMMSGDVLKQSKSQRAGLKFSVGKFHRWLCDIQVASCIHDWATVFLTAVMENLLEEIVIQSMPQQTEEMLTSESLDTSLTGNVELWGLLQPYAHLICSRTANGVLGLPNKNGSSAEKVNEKLKPNVTLVKNLEQCLLATCAGSIAELEELINRVVNSFGKGSGTPMAVTGLISGISASTSSSKQQSMCSWSKDALSTLFYFMRCSQLEHADNSVGHSHPALTLAHERPYLVLPPLVEWLRVSQAHCDHRQGHVVDSDDILQAARVLLPGLDCPPRPFNVDDPLYANNRTNSQTWSVRLKHDLALRMLAAGRPDLVPQAVQMLGSQNLNSFNEQGLTPLMVAALHGDESAVHVLLDAGADINATVPANQNLQMCSSLIGEIAGWSALNFAVVQKHVSLAQQLLNRNASVELSSMCTETPLQLAAMMGHSDLVNLLMVKGADPYYSTAKSDAGFKQKGCPSALALAAGHGHRNIVQLLLARRKGRNDEVLSLEDFLAEGSGGNGTVCSPSNNPSTIADIMEMSSSSSKASAASSSSSSSSSFWLGKLNKNQQKTLQEAVYHSAESAFVDITMDLRNLGIPWNTHTWTQTLAAAQELRRKALVQLLLADFVKYRFEDLNQEFVDDCLPLLFEIFRRSKNEITATQISKIFCQLYGKEPIPCVQLPESTNAPRIDPKFVNNPELSDVKFLIDGRLFYAHKIVLVNSSERFKRMLLESASSGDNIEIKDVRYDVFQFVIEFLYNGKLNEQNLDLNRLLQLLTAARSFDLTHLQNHCERIATGFVDIDSCLEIYRFASTIDAVNLIRYCEGFFLQNLLSIMTKVEGFRKLIYNSAKSDNNQGSDLIGGLLSTLTRRLEQKLKK